MEKYNTKNDVDFLMNYESFNLGGSRRMNQKYGDSIKISEDTDYDFYCADTIENRKMIENMGFTLVDAKDRSYWDNQLVDMYIKENIEILIRQDVELYKLAFESISLDDFIHCFWKSAPNRKIEDKALFSQWVCNSMNKLFRDNSIDINALSF